MQLNNVVKYINVFLASGLFVLEKASLFRDCFFFLFLMLCSGFQQALFYLLGNVPFVPMIRGCAPTLTSFAALSKSNSSFKAMTALEL